MNRSIHALAAGALLAAAPVLAAGTQDRPMTVHEALAHAQAKYPGEVVSLRYDQKHKQGPRYHVETLLPNGGIVKLDFDAATGSFGQVSRSGEPRPAISLARAIEAANARVPGGQVLGAEFDNSIRGDPHYDVDIRTPSGPQLVRVDLDGTVQGRTR